ncbi:MAG: helicase associated domain-containing protein [Colwellia sp.]|nr:helicase associated domain-containing protein [Colwellia sp.]
MDKLKNEKFESTSTQLYLSSNHYFDLRWNSMLKKLWDYYIEFGTLIVSSSYDKRLQQWTGAVRQQNKNGTLSRERKKCLDAIGFNWEP